MVFSSSKVDEIKSQVLCENDTVEVFTAACGEVTSRVVKNCVFDVFVLAGEIEVKTKVGDDAVVSFFYFFIVSVDNVCACAGFDKLVEGVEHVRDLNVIGKSFTRCAWNYVAAAGISLYYLGNAHKLLCVCKRRAAEFYNLNTHNILSG